MAYKKDSIFYIKSLCEKSGARYDIENERFIPEYEDKAEVLNYVVNWSIRELTRIIVSNCDKEKVLKAMKTKYKTQRKETTK